VPLAGALPAARSQRVPTGIGTAPLTRWPFVRARRTGSHLPILAGGRLEPRPDGVQPLREHPFYAVECDSEAEAAA
jgi:hypothetical protein